MKYKPALLAMAMVLLLAVGCKKNHVEQQTTPVPIANEIAVLFSAESLPLQAIDSAVVIIRDANQLIKKWETLQTRTAVLYASLTELPAGMYSAEVQVYTKKQNDNTARRYALAKSFTLPLQAGLQVKAPTGNFGDSWLKRAVLFAPTGEATAIVAMDPQDAFYQVQFREAKWEYASLQRSSLDGGVLMAVKEHVKNVSNLIGFSDYIGFQPYTLAMQGKQWTKSTTSLYLKHNTGHDVYLDYEYSRKVYRNGFYSRHFLPHRFFGS